MQFNKTVRTTLAMLCGLTLSARASLDDDLLFYAPFDGETTAAVARGNPEATHAIEPRFAPGLRGQALVVGGDPRANQRVEDGLPVSDKIPRNAVYQPEGNIDLQQGTLSLWVKPLDWHGDDNGFNVLFHTHAGRNYFMLYKFFTDDHLRFIVGEPERWTIPFLRIRDWTPGQWHHMVMTWSGDELRMYQNGHLVCRRRVRFPLENADAVEPFSVGPGGSWSHAFIGHSLIDEFRIYGRPLREAEIRSLYLADADAVEHDTGLIVLGERTPTQAGRIEDDDYAFDMTALGPSGVVEASLETSRVALSYDHEALYLAVLTPLEASAAEADEQVVLYLSTAPNRMLSLSVSADGTLGDPLESGLALDALRIRNTRADGAWLLEARLPFVALGQDGAPEGETWRFNLVRRYAAPDETVELAFTAGNALNRAHFVALQFDPAAPRLQLEGWRDAERSGRNARARGLAPEAVAQVQYISDNTLRLGFNTVTETLFADGQKTPYRSPAYPRRPSGDDVRLHETRVVETLEGHSRPVFVRKGANYLQEPLRVFYLYTHEARQLRASVRRDAPGAIRARFVRQADGQEAWRIEQPLPEDRVHFDAKFDLDFEALRPDTYTVHIDYVTPDGEADEIWQQSYAVPGPDHPAFHPYIDLEHDTVPAPWTPVEVSGFGVQGSGDREHRTEASTVDVQPSSFNLHPSSFQISTWGRTYGFGEGILFDSLVSQGEELLAAPALLRLNGEALTPGTVETVPGEATEIQASLTRRADLGALHADVRLVTHFDGYCEIDLELTPLPEGVEVQSLSLDIPLRGAFAQLVGDAPVNAFTGSRAGAVGDYWHQGFRGRERSAYFWVGGGRVGLNWLARGLDAWHNRPATITERQVELIREGDIVVVRLNLIDAPLTLDAPRTYGLGFTLTPSRPLDREILRRREDKDYRSWCQPWHYFAVPDYDKVDIDAIHRSLSRSEPGADEVYLYMGCGLTSPFTPEFPWFVTEWRPGGEYGNWTNADHRDLALRNRLAYTTASRKADSFFNWLQHTRARFFERAKTPLIPEATGYYFDTGPTIGDRYREMALNVYRMIRRTGPRARIYTHQGTQRVMPMQNFTDIICGGEGIGTGVTRDGNYYNVLTPEMFRAAYCPYLYGIKMVFIDMTVRVLLEHHPQALRRFDLDNPEFRRPLLHSYGYAVVHDVDIWDRYAQSLPLRRTLWAAQDALWWDTDVIFHPYWENDAVKRLGDDIGRIMASAYTKDGRMLLAVHNDTDDEREIALALDLDALGVTAGREGHDVFDPEARYPLAEHWTGNLPPRGFRLILWE